MKTTFTILTLAFTAFALPSYADPTDAATRTPGAHATFRFGQLEIAFPQTNPGATSEVSCDGPVTYSTKTRVATYAGNATIVITAPGQKPVTISGENLTVTQDK